MMVDIAKSYVYASTYSLWEKFIKIHFALYNIEVRPQELIVYIYFCMHGVTNTAYNLMLKDEMMHSRQTIDNVKTSLFKKELLRKTGSRRLEVLDSFKGINITDEFILKLRCRKKI